MAITSNDDIADFPATEVTTPEATTPGATTAAAESAAVIPSDNDPVLETVRDDAAETSGVATSGVWVLWRKHADGETEALRAFDNESRARADMDLAASISDDQFWLTDVPLLESEQDSRSGPSCVQALALTWLAQGAEAEASTPLDDPVVVSPRHVRGFVSVPPHEWSEMVDQGWVRDGMITPSGAAQVGLVRRPSDHGVG